MGDEVRTEPEDHPAPASLARLFPDDVATPLVADARYRDFVIARVLERGDSEDVRWLVHRFGEAALTASLQGRRARRLDRRNRVFWRLVLGPVAFAPMTASTWPLAGG